VHVLDVDALRRIAAHRPFGDDRRFVGGVVEHLDLEQLPRIIDLAHGVDQAIGNIHFVVNRQLDRDERQLGEWIRRYRHLVFVLHVQIDQVIPMPSVHGENDENEEVSAQDEDFVERHKRAGSSRASTISNYTGMTGSEEATKTSS
jgi:hypothetical protein